MKYSFKLANKIRTRLLLFIDEEMRAKTSNIISVNKNKNNYNSICEIRTYEESFSSAKKDDISYFNKNNNTNHSPKFQFNTYNTFRSHLNTNISPEYQTQKNSIEDIKNSGSCSKNKKYFYQSYKKQNNKMIFKKNIKNAKQKPKEYLKNLCKNLIIKSEFDKYYKYYSYATKKSKIYVKSPKSKPLKKNVEKREELDQSSNNIGSFKIILFTCDY